MPTVPPGPQPENEVRRLAAVRAHAILDTAPEVEFDTLTRVAAHAFNVPIALVAMMDSNRLWFKARLGLDVPQLDREVSFCAYAMLQPGVPLVVEDLRADPRFMESPLVTQAPHLRFYAGAPVVDAEGHVLGTLAVLDTVARSLCKAQVDALKDMSVLVMTALSARQRAMELQKLATTDHLTGIGNRVRFERALGESLEQTGRTGGSLTVLCLDLDGFKTVNDRFGHPAGDEVLRLVSQRLTSLVRKDDVLVRLGGDEFAILLTSGHGDAAQTLERRIVDSLQQPFVLPTGEIARIGVSIGRASCNHSPASRSSLIARADAALYQAKKRVGARR